MATVALVILALACSSGQADPAIRQPGETESDTDTDTDADTDSDTDSDTDADTDTTGTTGPCEFPQGVPDEGFIATAKTFEDTDPTVDDDVNDVLVALTGCGILSDCDITGFAGKTVDEICQSWFAAVTAELRAEWYCAGQHAVGSTDEIAVSNTGCDGKWYGYHVCNYGGPKVVWNPGARRGWWMIDPVYCVP